MIRQRRRWLPGRALVVVADSTCAVLELLADAARLSSPVTVITRLRLDAALYDPAPPREPGTVGRPRVKGDRQPTLATRLPDSATAWELLTVPWYGGGTAQVEVATGTALWYHRGLPPVSLRWVLLRDPQGQFTPQALLSTDPTVAPPQIFAWFVTRWQVEVTFHKVRGHLGVETQRQWSDLAILRTTPALLGLFSLVTLFAHARLDGQPLPVRQAAWYAKSAPTFSDTLAFVRHQLWPVTVFSTSRHRRPRRVADASPPASTTSPPPPPTPLHADSPSQPRLTRPTPPSPPTVIDGRPTNAHPWRQPFFRSRQRQPLPATT